MKASDPRASGAVVAAIIGGRLAVVVLGEPISRRLAAGTLIVVGALLTIDA